MPQTRVLALASIWLVVGNLPSLANSFADSSFGDTQPQVEIQESVTPERQKAEGGGFDDGSFGSDDGVSHSESAADDTRAASDGQEAEQDNQGAGDDQQEAGGGDFGTGGFEEESAETVVEPPKPQDDTAPVVIDNIAKPDDSTVAPADPEVSREISAFEMRDFGVQPVGDLRQGQFHGPTPTALPGGRLITTAELSGAMQAGQQMLIVDVLGGAYTIPSANSASLMAAGGTFQDRIQQQTAQWLGQMTGNNPTVPIVVLCSGPQCWLSYNAALRAINAGYQQVFWYRGGLRAWQMAGFPLVPSGF